MRNLIVAIVVAGWASAEAAPSKVEDLLQGQLILSDRKLPTTGPSAADHAQRLRAMARPTLTYDPATRAVTVEYAGFFARPLEAGALELAIYDVTGGRRDRVSIQEVPAARGRRACYGSIVLKAADYPARRTYRLALELRRSALAAGTVTLLDTPSPPPPDAGPDTPRHPDAGPHVAVAHH